jgi:23S rRNA (pseudouridine1915-N3)-methyltransferase
MRIIIAAVGKLKDSGELDLFARYQKRFDQAGRALALGPLTVIEHSESRLGEKTARKSEEATRLLKAVNDANVVIALDEHGRHETSDAFANHLGRLRDDGIRTLAFLIGGPDGHGNDVLKAASFTMSISTLTLPHGLARVVLAEQLYRATTILSGHPYHRA